LKIVKSPYINKIHPILMKSGRLEAGYVSRFVEIGMIKFHYATYLFVHSSYWRLETEGMKLV